MGYLVLVLVIFTGLCNLVLCTIYGNNVYVSEAMAWSQAREYCREHHVELSSNVSEGELYAFLQPRGQEDDSGDEPFIWTGRKQKGSTAEQQYAYLLLSPPQQNPDYDFSCVAQSTDGFEPMNCMKEFPFFCLQSGLALVKENKTWEEAMQHCRSLDSKLVSVSSDSALVEVLQASSASQTSRVWTGLRFLADSWLWLDGPENQTWGREAMPPCPDWSRLCGSLSRENQQLDSWDCADTFNFICISK